MIDFPEPVVSTYFKWKRYVDFPIALFLSIIALPIVVVAVLLVRLTSPGPGIYKQIRLGLDGKPFTIYKIRSMRADAEAGTGAVWAAKVDNRVTAIGKILRKTHIDELPQLLNVLNGDMSLVGPRPERPEFVVELEKRIEGYAYRFYVKPGLTGLAQLNQEPDVDLNDVRRKLVFDFDYIESSTFWFDVRVIICTSLKVLNLCRESTLRFFRLHREAEQFLWMSTLLPGGHIPSANEEERLSRIMAKQAT
jgi:lipopolysaccharide/colanic/teichoic acid biosynthesis glycosyltransferase